MKVDCTIPAAVVLAVVVAVHPAQAEEAKETRVRIDLGTAGSLTGYAAGDALELRTPYAATRVQTEHIKRVRVSPDDGRLELVLANGDKLARVSLVSPLSLRTDYGEIVLDGAALRNAATSAPPLSVAVTLSDGTFLAGEPRETSLKWADSGKAVLLTEIRELRSSDKPGEMVAGPWSGPTAGRVSVAKSLGLITPFGNLELPYARVSRARMVIRASKESPGARLGNVALASEGAEAECAVESRSRFLNDGRYSTFGHGRGYAYGETPCTFTVVLPELMYLTHIRFLLWQRDRRSYSYVLETSKDGVAWAEVADHSSGFRRSWEQHKFAARPARYVRVRGLGCTATAYFHIEELEAYCHTPRRRVRARWSSGVPDAEAELLVKSRSRREK